MWSPASPDTSLQAVSLQAPWLIFHQTPPASIPHSTLPACFQHWKLVPFTPFTGPPAVWVATTSHAGERRSPLGHSEEIQVLLETLRVRNFLLKRAEAFPTLITFHRGVRTSFVKTGCLIPLSFPLEIHHLMALLRSFLQFLTTSPSLISFCPPSVLSQNASHPAQHCLRESQIPQLPLLARGLQ